MTWSWLRAYYGTFAPDSLFVLALRDDDADADVAFFPLQLNEPRPRPRSVQYRTLLAGGSGGTSPADYTGVICRPESEAEALAAFAAYLRRIAPWDRLLMRDVQDPRVVRMLTAFSSPRFDVQAEEGVVCLYIDLPDAWEDYLKHLSSSTRSNERRYIRALETDEALTIRANGDGDVGAHFDTMFGLYRDRWPDMPDIFVRFAREVVACCHEEGRIYMPILWHDDTPIGAGVTFLDHGADAVRYWITAYDQAFASLSPGSIIRAHLTKWAIEQGYSTFDFLRGGEQYKHSYATDERHNSYLRVRRRTLRTLRLRVSRKGISMIRQLRSRALAG